MGQYDMATEMGEYLVGAYLQLEQQCDVLSFNVRPPGGGLKGLQELDVVGLNFKTNTAYLCEVAIARTLCRYSLCKPNRNADRQ